MTIWRLVVLLWWLTRLAFQLGDINSFQWLSFLRKSCDFLYFFNSTLNILHTKHPHVLKSHENAKLSCLFLSKARRNLEPRLSSCVPKYIQQSTKVLVVGRMNRNSNIRPYGLRLCSCVMFSTYTLPVYVLRYTLTSNWATGTGTVFISGFKSERSGREFDMLRRRVFLDLSHDCSISHAIGRILSLPYDKQHPLQTMH